MNLMHLSALGAALGICLLAFGSVQPGAPAQPAPSAGAARDPGAAEGLGWELGVQAWTFRDRTAFEAIDAAAALGLRCIELYPGQALSPEHREAEVGPALSAGQVDALKRKLESSGVKAMSYGVVTIKEEGAARKHFEFVKTMGMRTLVCEPVPEARDTVSRLADEYGLSVAIHNHPKPSLYWNPDTVLEALKERSRRMGACADTGHWTRSGLRPVEALKKLEGRVIELHFKDVARGVDQIWGTGDSNARAMLEELKRQGFRGQVYVEYESGSGTELEANVARCVAFFDATARELAAPPTKAE